MDGVGGVKFVEFWLATFNPPGGIILGVSGNELLPEVGVVSLFKALERGRKMPAPGWEVVK
jgi:hypothetical protein